MTSSAPILGAALQARYYRHVLLKEIGGRGQDALARARVLIVGIGGLGTPLAQYLAAAGVGTLGLCDDDVVALDNLQRQILFRTDDIGREKIVAARDTLVRLNPDPQYVLHRCRITSDTVTAILADYDLIADCSDNFSTRFCLNDACAHARKPLASAAITRFDGQIALFKPYMRDASGAHFSCYRSLVPHPPEATEDCATLGVIGAVGGVIGSLQALEIIKEITVSGDSLAGFVLIYDGLRGTMRRVVLPPSPLFTDGVFMASHPAVARDPADDARRQKPEY